MTSTITDAVKTATAPFKDTPALWFIGYGAAGGYAMAAGLQVGLSGTVVSLTNRWMLESLLVGGATNWLALITGLNPDPTSITKGAALGAAGQYLWFRTLRPIAVNWSLVA
jgi:hypothetical protein